MKNRCFEIYVSPSVLTVEIETEGIFAASADNSFDFGGNAFEEGDE